MSATPPAARRSDRTAVVVLTWNAADTIADCLRSLQSEVRAGDVVVVADNGSGDGTVAAVRALALPCVELVEHGENLGFAAGNNRAIEPLLARGFEFVFVLNPDTVVERGALAALRAAAADAPSAGVLQPLLLDAADPARADSLGLVPRWTFGGQDRGRGKRVSDRQQPQPIFGACGAAAFCRADTLAAVGLFDEELFVLAEDLDLAFRVRLSGREVLLVPAARVRHRRGISGHRLDGAAALRRKFWLQRNTVALALRYWPGIWLWAFWPSLLWRAAQALLLAAADPERRCVPLWRRSWAARAALRRAMRARGLDRWFR